MTAQTIAANELVERLQGLLEKATKGSFFIAEGGICARPCPDDGSNVLCLEPERVMRASLARWPDNAALIVGAVNALPDLLATITRLTDELAGVKEALRPFAEACNISTADDSESLYDTLACEKITWRDLRRARALLGGRE